jgi:hypothetical protein
VNVRRVSFGGLCAAPVGLVPVGLSGERGPWCVAMLSASVDPLG